MAVSTDNILDPYEAAIMLRDAMAARDEYVSFYMDKGYYDYDLLDLIKDKADRGGFDLQIILALEADDCILSVFEKDITCLHVQRVRPAFRVFGIKSYIFYCTRYFFLNVTPYQIWLERLLHHPETELHFFSPLVNSGQNVRKYRTFNNNMQHNAPFCQALVLIL